MSWQDRYENSEFSIQTGDGRIYRPIWTSGSKQKEYNTAIYEFVDVLGSFVDRKKPRSAHFELVFYFQGEDHIDDAEAFEFSADDPRMWKVEHPIYGTIYGQPLEITRNDEFLNSTQILVDFWETTTDKKAIHQKVSPLNIVSEKSDDFQLLSSTAFESKTDLDSSDLNNFKGNVLTFSSRYQSILNNENFQEYQRLFSNAMTSIDNILEYPALAIQDINRLVMWPGTIINSLKQRINFIGELLKDIGLILDKPSQNNNSYYEAIAGAAITSLFVASMETASEDFFTRSEVQSFYDNVLNSYNSYLSSLDGINDTGPEFSSISALAIRYLVSFEPQNALATMFPYVLNHLIALSFESKQERTIILDRDSNIVLLTHKYFGLDNEDVNLERFRRLNNVRNKRLFQIKKGSRIKYFV